MGEVTANQRLLRWYRFGDEGLNDLLDLFTYTHAYFDDSNFARPINKSISGKSNNTVSRKV